MPPTGDYFETGMLMTSVEYKSIGAFECVISSDGDERKKGLDFAWYEFKSYNFCKAVMQSEIILDLADMVAKGGQKDVKGSLEIGHELFQEKNRSTKEAFSEKMNGEEEKYIFFDRSLYWFKEN